MSDCETNNFIEIRFRLLWVLKEKGEILTELEGSFLYPSASPSSDDFNSTRITYSSSIFLNSFLLKVSYAHP